MRGCVECSRQIEAEFRFCPHCGASQRLKIVEYFRGHPEIDGGGLRVSAYLTSPPHVRFSIWRSSRAEAVVSLEPQEASRLGRFLSAVAPAAEPPSLASELRRSARAICDAIRST